MLAVRFEHPLVVTSGNISHEPQIIDNAEALVKLAAIADLFLLHDREIANRIDDSVALVVHARPRLLRRARGYAPSAMRLPPGFERAPDLLAFGGELKSTFCLLKDGAAVLSQHQGDLEDLATFDDYQKNLGLGGLMLGSRSTRAAGGDPRRIVIFLEGNGTRPVCMRDPLTLETLEGLAGKPITSNRDYGHDDPPRPPRVMAEPASRPEVVRSLRRVNMVDLGSWPLNWAPDIENCRY